MKESCHHQRALARAVIPSLHGRRSRSGGITARLTALVMTAVSQAPMTAVCRSRTTVVSRSVMTAILVMTAFAAVAPATPLVSKAETRRDYYLNAVSACARGIETRAAELLRGAGARDPKAIAQSNELRLLRRWLEPISGDRDRFRRQFTEGTREDRFVQTLQAALRREGATVDFYDDKNPGQCQGTQVAYFTPGARKEVGMCLKRTDLLGRSIVGFIHESLHLYQFSKGPLKDLLTYPFAGAPRTSTRALAYSPDAKYIDLDNGFAGRGTDLIGSLPTPVRARAVQLLWALDGMKTLYLMYPKENGTLEFLPKKPWVIPEDKFYSALDDKLAGPHDWDEETTDLRLGIGLTPAQRKSKGEREIHRLSEAFHEWMRAHPVYERKPRKEALMNYLAALAADYAALMKAAGPQRAKLDELFGMFFVSSRIMRGLLNFCAEMQANMQSRMLLYIFYQKIQSVPQCRGIQPMYWSASTAADQADDIFSTEFPAPNDFERIDSAIERWTRRYISKTQSYGPSFSFLYGYDSFPQIFNAESCGKFKEEYVNFRPQ